MKTRRQKLSEYLLSTNRRNERSENGRENSLPIPIDLIDEIFSRLPLKSIARCRCVSKLWASLLRRPDFTELFLTKSCARPQLLIAFRKESELFFFSAPQPQNPDENSSPVVASYHMKFSFDGSFKMGGLAHGLVGLTDKRISNGKKITVPVICNPSTGKALILPKLNTRRVEGRSLFGYDPIDKQFKVLSMTGSSVGINNVVSGEHQVMTLGTGNPSWRPIKCCCIPRYYPHKEICINGVLYYPSVDSSTEASIIVCFDVRSEKFTIVKSKAAFDGTMVNYNGKLGLLRYLGERYRSIKLWVLEDVEKQEWSEHIYVLPPLWKNAVERSWLGFVGVIGTNEIVMRSRFQPAPCYLFYFNIERNTIVEVKILGMDVSKYDTSHFFLNHVEDVKLM